MTIIIVVMGMVNCLSKPDNINPIPTELPKMPTPGVTAAPELTAVPTPTVKATPEPAAIEFEISKEVYNKTFDEIDIMINRLNTIINKRDFESWVDILTNNYISEKSDDDYLEKMSEMPTLKNRGKRLGNLRDYFINVIVPSRAKAKLEKIIFVDSEHVKAYGTIFKQSGILYYFEKIDNQWKIGIW